MFLVVERLIILSTRIYTRLDQKNKEILYHPKEIANTTVSRLF